MRRWVVKRADGGGNAYRPWYLIHGKANPGGDGWHPGWTEHLNNAERFEDEADAVAVVLLLADRVDDKVVCGVEEIDVPRDLMREDLRLGINRTDHTAALLA